MRYRKELPRGSSFLQHMIIWADILVMAVVHAEAAGDDAEGSEAEALVQMPRVRIAGDDGIELQDAEAVRPALLETVGHQLFADVQTARRAFDGIACIADMAAAADIIGMQDIKAVNMAGQPVFGDGGKRLRCEKGCAGCRVQLLLLREGDAVLHDLVPDADQIRQICLRICSDFDFHRYSRFLPFDYLDGFLMA